MTKPIPVGYSREGNECKADKQNAEECPSEVRQQGLGGLAFVHSERVAAPSCSFRIRCRNPLSTSTALGSTDPSW